MGYSLDLRERILKAKRRGQTTAAVAAQFSVGKATVERYDRLERQTGGLQQRPYGHRPRIIGPAQDDALLAQLHAYPDATLDEHCQRWLESSGVWVSDSTMCRALRRLGWTRKKRR